MTSGTPTNSSEEDSTSANAPCNPLCVVHSLDPTENHGECCLKGQDCRHQRSGLGTPSSTPATYGSDEPTPDSKMNSTCHSCSLHECEESLFHMTTDCPCDHVAMLNLNNGNNPEEEGPCRRCEQVACPWTQDHQDKDCPCGPRPVDHGPPEPESGEPLGPTELANRVDNQANFNRRRRHPSRLYPIIEPDLSEAEKKRLVVLWCETC